MKVICTANRGKALPLVYFALGDTPESEFNLSIGRTYYAFAIALWQSCLHLLIFDDSKRPRWNPIELFSISDPHLPDEWFFATYTDHPCGVSALWGYETLIVDPNHYERLTEQEPDAVAIFEEERRKRGVQYE